MKANGLKNKEKKEEKEKEKEKERRGSKASPTSLSSAALSASPKTKPKSEAAASSAPEPVAKKDDSDAKHRVLKDGNLQWQGGKWNNWLRRYVVLYEDTLELFKQKKDTEKKKASSGKIIKLMNVLEVVANVKGKRKNTFKVVTSNQGEYFFDASDAKEMTEWVQRIEELRTKTQSSMKDQKPVIVRRPSIYGSMRGKRLLAKTNESKKSSDESAVSSPAPPALSRAGKSGSLKRMKSVEGSIFKLPSDPERAKMTKAQLQKLLADISAAEASSISALRTAYTAKLAEIIELLQNREIAAVVKRFEERRQAINLALKAKLNST